MVEVGAVGDLAQSVDLVPVLPDALGPARLQQCDEVIARIDVRHAARQLDANDAGQPGEDATQALVAVETCREREPRSSQQHGIGATAGRVRWQDGNGLAVRIGGEQGGDDVDLEGRLVAENDQGRA